MTTNRKQTYILFGPAKSASVQRACGTAHVGGGTAHVLSGSPSDRAVA